MWTASVRPLNNQSIRIKSLLKPKARSPSAIASHFQPGPNTQAAFPQKPNLFQIFPPVSSNRYTSNVTWNNPTPSQILRCDVKQGSPGPGWAERDHILGEQVKSWPFSSLAELGRSRRGLTVYFFFPQTSEKYGTACIPIGPVPQNGSSGVCCSHKCSPILLVPQLRAHKQEEPDILKVRGNTACSAGITEVFSSFPSHSLFLETLVQILDTMIRKGCPRALGSLLPFSVLWMLQFLTWHILLIPISNISRAWRINHTY